MAIGEIELKEVPATPSYCEKELAETRHHCINVTVANCDEPHFGDKHVYHGPVTVKQIVTTSLKISETTSSEDSGHVFSVLHFLTKDKDSLRYCPSMKTCCLTMIAVTIIVGIGIVAYYAAIGFQNGSEDESTNQITIYNRASWKAREPVREIENIKTPIPVVMIIHAESVNCYTFEQCAEMVKGFQHWHIDNLKYPDISFNFLVGGEGGIYEGRGWGKEGQHTLGYNMKSLGICFIGDFQEKEPTPEQIHQTHRLLEFGIAKGKLSEDYSLLGQRQVKKTNSPGDRLFELMKEWPHFNGSVHYP